MDNKSERIKLLEELYIKMQRIRQFENKSVDLLNNNEIVCPVHLYTGQEAIAAGICQELIDDDYVFSTHRSHGHYIAKGGSIKKLMAEIFGKETGCSRGKGGSMHLVDSKKGLMGSSAIVAGSISLAVGTALSSKIQNNKKVSVAFFGDGATDEGVFYESLNFASLNKLPMIFVCENNLFSTHLPIELRHANVNLLEIAKTHNIKSVQVDGNDVEKVNEIAKEMVESARNGEGPYFIEAMTYRWLSHVGPWQDLDIGYRKKKDVEHWMNRCPIKKVESDLNMIEGYDINNLNTIENIIKGEIEEAYSFAKESNYPENDELYKDLFTSNY